MLLTAQNISKRFRRKWVLKEVNFTVKPGELLGLIGPNGAGKTTLFECVAGLMHTNAGSVRFQDKELPLSRRKDALFYMPDQITPWSGQTVKWALAFFGKLYGSHEKASDLAESLKLQDLMRARIGTLSKGERKRLLLALALLTHHPLLLLDEPFDGLDLRQTREAMALLRSHAEGGRTMMLSIHQLADAARVCDRVVLLSAGRVAGEGTVSELRRQANLSEGGLEEIFLALT